MKKDAMIPISPRQWQYESWKKAYSAAIQNPAQLLDYLQLPSTLLAAAEQAAVGFPLRVPMSYLQRMNKGRRDDPLLLQVLPLQQELARHRGFSQDPVGDLIASPLPGLIHKYHDRALVMLSGACAVHCRYCFRRHFPYAEHGLHPENWQSILEYLDAKQISEVIFSGGDPWSLSDEKIDQVLRDLAPIASLKRIRWHTRLPVVIPSRVTPFLLQLLSRQRQKQIVVLHINHAQEINDELSQAINALRDSGAILLNQSVLLRHINDSAVSLANLSQRLFDSGVLPYYLHELDKVQGAWHFRVPRRRARRIMRELATLLPGYLLPRYVVEEAGAANKTAL